MLLHWETGRKCPTLETHLFVSKETEPFQNPSHLAAEYFYDLTECDMQRITTSAQNTSKEGKKKIAQRGSTIFTIASGAHDLYIGKWWSLETWEYS